MESPDGDEDSFIPQARPPSLLLRESKTELGVDLQDMCKCAAKLVIPWSNAVTETTMSCYKGKMLPKAKIVSQAITTIVVIVPKTW